MRKIVGVILALLLAVTASAEVSVRNGKFFFNGVKKEEVWGRTSFKLANILTYNFTGQGVKYTESDELAFGAKNRLDATSEMGGESERFTLSVRR